MWVPGTQGASGATGYLQVDKEEVGLVRRVFLMLVVSAILVLALAVPALADATLNESNCAGVYFSNRAPAFESGGRQGERARTQAQEGIRGDVLKANQKLYANCGDNGVPG